MFDFVSDYVAGIVTVGVIMILAILAASVVLMRLRRRAIARQEASSGEAFTIEALERMREARQITREEYRVLRRAALGLPAEPNPPAESSSSPPAPDVDAQ